MAATFEFDSHYRRGRSDECWNWQGYVNTRGYGVFGSGSRRIYAHRYAAFRRFGKQPSSVYVCHTCDNPICVNPLHLFLGDPAANMNDKCKKGRQARGVRSNLSNLTDSKVREIRRIYAAGFCSQQTLADRHGVSQVAISHIIRRKTWRHV